MSDVNPVEATNDASIIQQQQEDDDIQQKLASREVIHAKSQYFSGSVNELRIKFPKVYKAIEEYVGQAILSSMRRYQNRLKEAMKQYNQ